MYFGVNWNEILPHYFVECNVYAVGNVVEELTS